MITNHPTMTEFEVQRSKLTDILNNYTCRVVKNTSCLEANQLLIYKTQPRSWICSNWGQIQPKAERKCWTQDHKTMSPFRAIRTQLCCTPPPLRGKNNLEIKKINARDVGMGFEIIFPVLRMFTIFFYTVQCPSIWPSARLPASKCHDKLPPPQKCL